MYELVWHLSLALVVCNFRSGAVCSDHVMYKFVFLENVSGGPHLSADAYISNVVCLDLSAVSLSAMYCGIG